MKIAEVLNPNNNDINQTDKETETEDLRPKTKCTDHLHHLFDHILTKLAHNNDQTQYLNILFLDTVRFYFTDVTSTM